MVVDDACELSDKMCGKTVKNYRTNHDNLSLVRDLKPVIITQIVICLKLFKHAIRHTNKVLIYIMHTEIQDNMAQISDRNIFPNTQYLQSKQNILWTPFLL